jgi:cell wall-associated NlpC family hydrolase
MADLAKYIGIPYEKKNCLDLVKDFYRQELGLEIKEYYEGNTPDRREVETLIASNRGDFVKVDRKDARLGDLVIVRLYGIESHIGIFISSQFMLHSARGIGSCIERLKKYESMISGFYRHRELTT